MGRRLETELGSEWLWLCGCVVVVVVGEVVGEANPTNPSRARPDLRPQGRSFPLTPIPSHPIPSHPPPTPIAQPASRGKASACHGLEQLTSSCPRCSLLNSIGPGPEHSALLPCCPPAIAPSLAEDSQPSLNPRGASLTQRPRPSARTLCSLDDSARPTGYHYVDFVLSGSPCSPPPPGH